MRLMMKGSRWGCCGITAGSSVIHHPVSSSSTHASNSTAPPRTPTTQVHVKSLPPTFMGCDLWKRDVNFSFKNSNVQHTEEALAPSCSVTGTVTGGRRWTELCSPLHVVTDAVTNILKRAEVSCTTQLLEFESLGFFFRPSPLFSVTSFLFQSKQFDIFSC